MDERLARVLKGEASAEEAAAVREWRRASQEHEVEYRQFARLVELSARIPELIEVPPRPSVSELVHVPLHRRLPQPARRWLAAAAAAAVLLLGAFLYARGHGSGPAAAAFGVREIVTSASETATLELDDGTVVRLAPSSRLRVLGDRDGRGEGGRIRREVALEGRSFFAVAKRNGTPFVIRTDAGDVTVLGTRLDVEARARHLRLLVVEGRVALSTRRQRTELVAGEMGRVLNGETAPVVKVPDVGPFVGWTGRFLAFQSTPLGDAAREIERVYGVRVEIPDVEMARRVITAWFWDKSLTEVVDVVCLAVAARCTVNDGVVQIMPETAQTLLPAGVNRNAVNQVVAHGGGR